MAKATKSIANSGDATGNASSDLAIVPAGGRGNFSNYELVQPEAIQKGVDGIYKTGKFIMDMGLVPGSAKDYNLQQICLIIAMGSNVGFDPVSSLSMINIIDGKPTLQSSAISALLSKHGVAVEVVRDYEPIYEEKPSYITTEETNPTTGEVKKVPQIDSEGRFMVYKNFDGTPFIQKRAIDWVTTLRFKRYMGPVMGVVVNEISFYISDAKALGLLDKSNWRKMPKQMLYARALARGARAFASDIVHGMYEVSEIADSAGVIVLEDDNGSLVVVNETTE